MKNTARVLKSLAAVAGMALVFVACVPLGGIGLPGGGGGDSLYGEVRSVDSRRGRIQVREQYGRDYTVRVDNRTRVVYDRRQYPVSTLERGDEVRLRVQYDRNNALWADHIEVVRSARRSDRDRGDVWSSTRVQRVDGRVANIDQRRGYFTVDRGRNSSVSVFVTGNTRRDDVRRFERLRRGDRVRVEIRQHGNYYELVRFR